MKFHISFSFFFLFLPFAMKRKAAARPITVRRTAKKRVRLTGPRTYQAGRELLKTPKQELKAFDVAATGINFDTPANPPVFVALNAVVNGAELYQRVGRKIYMKNIHIRGFVVNTATSTQDMGRILVVYDSQPNIAFPTIAQLLQDSNAAAATSGLSEINLTNRARFQILRDYQVLLPSATNTAGVLTNFEMTDQIKNSFNIDMFIKLKGLESVFNGTNGGTIADITSGSIFITCVTQNNNAEWAFEFTSRLRFYD